MPVLRFRNQKITPFFHIFVVIVIFILQLIQRVIMSQILDDKKGESKVVSIRLNSKCVKILDEKEKQAKKLKLKFNVSGYIQNLIENESGG